MAILALETTVSLHGSRERLLLPSRSGRRLTVVEVHSSRLGPGDSESDWEDELFQISGWLPPAEAEQRLASERWLSPASLAAMRAGRVLTVAELEWDS